MRCHIPAKKKEEELDPVLKKVLEDFGGTDAIKIAKVLIKQEGEEITDEKIADLSKVKLNIVRKILYILNENKLTEFRRVRDKRSGWFIYFWHHSFDYDNLKELIEERRDIVIQRLESRLENEETNLFFICNKGCDVRMKYVEAMERNFICPKCNEGVLVEDDNHKIIDLLKKTIINLRSH